ncbi:MAG: MATE family efflux transporter [Bacteroidales bacterium]|nr:MATE family efflux transporter [Bacteroidales bacterium]
MNKIYKLTLKFSSLMYKGNIKYKRLVQDVKEAIAGTEQDFTTGSLKRAIFLLSVPMVLEMVMESIFAVVDIYFVSRLGAEAVATVGITESLVTIVYAIGIGLSMATTALVSRRIGEKNPEGAAKAAFQSIITGLFVSLLIAIPGIIYASKLLQVMGASEEIYANMSSYTAIMLGGNAVIMLLFIINAVFRSAGDAAISMRVLWVANIINLILDPMLIFGIGPFPELGVMGAAVATNIGRGLAVIYQFYLLFKGNGRVKLLVSHISVHLQTIRSLLKLSVGGIGQNVIAMSSWIGLVRIISEFGSEAIAGYTIAIRIIVFSLLPSWGISNAAATLVGQNLGAKKPGRAEKAVWAVGKVNMASMGIISVILILFPSAFIRLFIDDPAVIFSGAASLRILAYGFILYGLGMVMVQALNGAGDTLTPTKINFFCFWLLEIPLAYFLALSLGIGETGVYYSIVIAESVMTIAAAWYFKRGKWKLKEV